MTESAASDTRRGRVPAAFNQHNRDKFQRVVRLTQQAIVRLTSQGRPITLAAVAEATRAGDESGKGLTPATILRNVEARALFHQNSPAYQARQQRAQRASRTRPRTRRAADIPLDYRGLRARDLVPMLEALKAKLVTLQTQQAQLQTERDEAVRLRDAAVEQSTRQLAVLTQRQTQSECSVLPVQNRSEPGQS